MNRVYLDNAASTPLDPEVLEHMIPYYRDFHGNPSSVHGHGRKIRSAIETARKKIASLLGAAPAEIFFTSGGTEADNMAIKCVIQSTDIRHIVSSELEHHAVKYSIEGLQKTHGVEVTWLNCDEKGNIDLDQLDQVLSANPRSLVSLMQANNEIGTITDVNRVGEICKKYDAIFHTDAVQAMGNIPYNLANTNIHFLAASAHKFYGPKGVGFLYMKAGMKVPPLICGGGQERNMRAGTENFVSIMGMAFALEKCINTLEEKNAKLWKLKNYLKEALLRDVPDVRFNGEIEEGKSLPTVLNVSFPSDGQDSMLLFNLDIQGISASGGSACTSGSLKGSHVLQALGVEPARATNSVRFSFGIQNTIEELEFTVEKLRSFVKVPG